MYPGVFLKKKQAYPLQNCFECRRFAANLQQICCRLICLQERRINVLRCLQLAVIFLWTSQLFAAYLLLQTYVCRKIAENHASFSNNKKMFAGGLQETSNHSEMFTGNLRELSIFKIVCRKLAEILNKHIFDFEPFQCRLKRLRAMFYKHQYICL